MDLLDRRKILEECCSKHGTQLWQIQFPDRETKELKTSIFCPDCTQEDIALHEEEILLEARNQQETHLSVS